MCAKPLSGYSARVRLGLPGNQKVHPPDTHSHTHTKGQTLTTSKPITTHVSVPKRRNLHTIDLASAQIPLEFPMPNEASKEKKALTIKNHLKDAVSGETLTAPWCDTLWPLQKYSPKNLRHRQKGTTRTLTDPKCADAHQNFILRVDPEFQKRINVKNG